MKRGIFCGLLLCILLFSSVARAEKVQLLFWYPGEAGSQAEAQPLLDAFSTLLNTQSPAPISATYHNDRTAGEQFIQQQHPTFGILSYHAWLNWQNTHPKSKVFLQVLPNHGQLTEKYVLVGKSAPQGQIQVLSSEPLSENFLTQQLFPHKTWSAKMTSSKQLLFKLKELADGKWSGYCLLSPREATSFAALKSPWKQQLSFTQSSAAVSTARLIIFAKEPPQIEQWKKTFLELSKNPAANEVLEELSLSGFAE